MVKMVKKAVLAVVLLLSCSFLNMVPAFAERSLLMTPLNESVILNPGDSYSGSFKIRNTATDGEELAYVVSVGPFYVDENHSAIFVNENDRSRIVEWIKIKSPEKGVLKPDESRMIEFTIDVPESAPAGGQYACISVGSDPGAEAGEGDGVGIRESLAIGYTIFAEITGESIVSGEVESMSIQSILLGGNIAARSLVKNTGNVHSVAKYTMKVYPLFSDQTVYNSDEHVLENSDTHTIFPDRTYEEESVWENTPMVGIFNVLYTVEYQGLTSEITSLVIVCPWWLLILILIGLIIMILRIVTLVKLHRMPKESKIQAE